MLTICSQERQRQEPNSRLAPPLFLVACWYATVPTVPTFQGQGRPPGQ
jgi:hypothetical protein